MGDPIFQVEVAFFWGNVATHCKVISHSMVSCAKTAELIEMSFWMKIWVGPRNHVLDGGADPPRGRGNFWWLFRPFNSIYNLCFSVAVAFAAIGIIQSPIISCSRRDHSVCQASANSILKISVRKRCSLSSAKGAVGLHRSTAV